MNSTTLFELQLLNKFISQKIKITFYFCLFIISNYLIYHTVTSATLYPMLELWDV